MPSQIACSLELNLSDIDIKRELSRSKASTIYEIRLFGKPCVMKLFHDNGDPGYTKKGRDLNRFRCELNAYHNLREFGVCDRGFVPAFYGHIDRVDPSAFHPPLKHFADDKHQPSAILLEYLPCAERLNCENYSEDLFRYAVEGIKQIHNAFVHHHDIYPKNMLVVSGTRIVWVDFDVATTFSSMGPCEKAYCDYETELVESFGKLLNDDKRQGLPPNTKYY
ncbi:hypothetical protein N7460_006843 [Penicillium canescens]|uniref:Protein kinase domain-containing protein n=1 Tax=Penicillium canescens TaxID=5083 RepID=A0AAD6IB99_PENCN|nr:hypothetical protein N7460_006843 [Penicillium canescens]KAJ6065772.1 hypothetical protein N7444_001425 [Penicillium canescens]